MFPRPVEPAAAALRVACSRRGNARRGSGRSVLRYTFGTSVEFDPNPVRAAKQAAKIQKLLMVLHVSGNFEDAAFT